MEKIGVFYETISFHIYKEIEGNFLVEVIMKMNLQVFFFF